MVRRALAIRRNISATSAPCALCRRPTERLLGPDLFTADDWRPVCWDCGEEHDPDMVAMLTAYRAFNAPLFVVERQEQQT